MVKIQQIAEPAALTKARRKKLKRAVERWNERQAAADATAKEQKFKKLNKYLNGDYDVVKDELTLLQHGKCAYCERWASGTLGQIDHFRPRRPIDVGWWWLNWSWDNLLLSCGGCNGEKKETSPLMDTTRASVQPIPPATVAVLEAWTPQREGETILHPRLEDPAGALSWVLLDAAADPKDWKVLVNDLNLRGKETRRLVNLDQHLDDVTEHVRQHLGAFVLMARHLSGKTRISKQIRTLLRRLWDDLLRVTVKNPRAQFRAATASVLTQLWFHDNLGPTGLDLPAPSLPFP